MGIRPAKTVRDWKGQAWARVSQRKPRKSYVKGAPRPKVRQYNMGTDKRFELEAVLSPTHDIQLRDNQLEAARQAANKFLEKNLVDNFFMSMVAYPHLVIREHSALGVAGADRISKGMKRAFGKPKGRMARVRADQAVFRARIMSKDVRVLKEAFRRAQLKMSGTFNIVLTDIRNDAKNLARSIVGRKMKKKEKEEAKPAAEAAPAEAAKEEAKPVEKKGSPMKELK